MKNREFQLYKEKSIPELKKELALNREKMVKLTFDLSAGKIKNIREIREVKKTIAKILTLINKK